MKDISIIRLLLPVLFVLCLAFPAAAEPAPGESSAERTYPVETLNGLWRADIEGTKRLLGEEQAAKQAKEPDVCLELDMKAKSYRIWKDVSKKELLDDFLFELLGVEGNTVKLRFEGGRPTEIRIVDKDTLNLQGFAIIRRVTAVTK